MVLPAMVSVIIVASVLSTARGSLYRPSGSTATGARATFVPAPTGGGGGRGRKHAGSSAAFSPTTGAATGSRGHRRRREQGRSAGFGIGVDGDDVGPRRTPRTALHLLRGEGGEDLLRADGFRTWAGEGGRTGKGASCGGSVVGDGNSRSRTRRAQQRYQQGHRQQQQRLAARWAVSLAAGGTSSKGGGGGSGDDRAVDGSEGEGLLFGDISMEEGDNDGEDSGSEEMVVEVDEEELMEEWKARGLNPEAFDPMVLLQMWEEEDAEEEEDMDKETIDAMMEAAAAAATTTTTATESVTKGGSGSRGGRLMKERSLFQGMDDGDGDVDDGDMDDVDAVMEAAATRLGPGALEKEDGDQDLPETRNFIGSEGAPSTAGAGGAPMEGRAVGIDLGTTNSAVAVIVDGQPVMVPNKRGKVTTPSVVSFRVRSSSSGGGGRSNPNKNASAPSSSSAAGNRRRPAAGRGRRGTPPRTNSPGDLDYGYSDDSGTGGSTSTSTSNAPSSRETARKGAGGGEGGDGDRDGSGGGGLARIYVGEAAVARIATHPKNTYSSVKRIVGRTKKQAKEAGVGLGALNVDQSQSYLRLKCPAIGDGATIPPEELSAEILRVLIRDAERFMGGVTVKRAVIGVPAYFNPAQCAATERAGQMAGLDKVKLMREPEAAALAYGLDKGGDELILVFDLGGGTFDVSVLEVGGGIAEVIATAGDSQLGGDDFDQAVTEWLSDEVTDQGGGDPRSSPVATRQLLEAARAARERLSDASETEVVLPFADGRRGSTTLTRGKMESLIMEPLKRIMAPMREVAIMADISLPGDTGAFMDYDLEDSRDFREGGSANTGEGGGEGGSSLRKLRSEQSRARKKARAQSKSLRKQVSSMAEVAKGMEGNAKLRRFPQGGRMIDKVVLVGGATRMPSVQRLVGGITGVKPKRTVDPDQAVALGAAAFAGILEGEVEGQEVMTSWQASIYRMMARDGMMQ